MLKRTFVALAATIAVVLGSGLVVPTAANAAGDDAALQHSKSVVGATSQFKPGDRFDYEIEVGCSSTTSPGCVDTFLLDTLPAPLVFDPDVEHPVTVNVAGGASADISFTTDENGRESFRVDPKEAFGTGIGAGTGIRAGGSMVVTVSVFVPTTTGGEFNGTTITNTSIVDAANAPERPSSADVTLDVATTLVPKLTKTVVPGSTIPAVPGRAVDWTLSPGNASNQTVDTIMVQDPANPPLASLGYLDITSLDITDPAGTTGKVIEYFVGTAWTTTAPVPLSAADGVRVTFSGTFAPGASGDVVVHSLTNDTVKSIAKGDSVAIKNDASTTVAKNAVTSAPVKKDATVTVANQDPDVDITKSFERSALVSGQSTTAEIIATVGAQNVQTLQITEPSANQPNFTAQGLTFDGFGSGLEWPEGATSAKIEYTYSDGTTSAVTTTTVHTLGAPTAGRTVEGFRITFTADGDDIPSRAYATLPLKVTALPVTTAAAHSGTNHVDVRVENVDGASGTDNADASITVAPLEVKTEASKRITPETVFGVAGTEASVVLTGKVTDDSTIGSKSLILSDPVDPEGNPEFWDAFTPTSIENTDIPACSTLTLRYWSKSARAWTILPGANTVAGPAAKWGIEVPQNLRGDVGGIQYEFLPTCSDLLPPGFVVISHMNIEVTERHTAETTYTNVVQSAVHNPDAINPDHTDDAQDDIIVTPLDGSGTGVDLIDKNWLEDSVAALSKGSRALRIGWSTQGLNLETVQISDPGNNGELTNVATSVYDAFDLVAIKPITSASDPQIVNDRVSKVELYTAANQWVDVTGDACAKGCDGQFGGYTLTTQERADALGVRITFTERTAGAGVGSSYERRPIDLVFEVRDTLRSNPAEWVLGEFHDGTYNTGTPGLVNNTASARGVNTATGVDVTSRANDEIEIIDSPINVSLTKTFDQDLLGVPQAGTAQEDYPLISSKLVATNKSATRVSSMVITDPDASQTGPTAFDVLNLHSIDALGAPTGMKLGNAVIKLTRSTGITTSYTAQEAIFLSSAELADVIGVEFAFTSPGNKPVIAPEGSGTMNLTWQLRATHRSDGSPMTPTATPIVNRAGTQIDSPGRIVCPGTACSTGAATAEDDFKVVAAGYTITTGKRITPETVNENRSKAYATTLTAQPVGNARTVLMTMTDFSPTFWNTMDYVSSSMTVPAPINQVKMDVLVSDPATGVVSYQLVNAELVALCDGAPIDAASPCIVQGAWQAVAPSARINFTKPAIAAGAEIVGVQYQARRVFNGVPTQWERPSNPKLEITLNTERREFLRSSPTTLVSTTRPGLAPNPGETAPGVISNSLTSTGNAQFGQNQPFTDTKTADASTKVQHLVNAIKVTKTRGSTPTVNPAGPVNFIMTVENTGQWDMTGFALTDQIGLIDGSSPLVEPLPKGYTFTITGAGAPSGNAGFSAWLDPATGALAITNSDPNFVFKSGWKLTINAPLRFRPGLSPDVTVTNSITAKADRDFERCESTTTDLVPNAATANVPECTADTAVVPRSSATVAMKKWVKGDGAGDPATTRDDLGVLNVRGVAADCDPSTPGLTSDGFTSYPCAPITRPGGEASWRLDFLNTGNTNAKVVAAVDVLPDVGDKGVIVGTPRGSQFAVTMLGKMSDNLASLADGQYGTLRGYFSTKVLDASCNENAIAQHTAGKTPDARCDFGWIEFDATTPETALQAAKSIKFVTEFANPNNALPAPGLHPGETLSITFNTRTPFLLPAVGADPEGTPVAYNSFAGSSRTVATATQAERAELVLEPQRVGIATATGQLNLVKIVDAPAFANSVQLPTAYEFLVTCVSGGQPVTLLNAAGANASRPSVPADGSTFLYNNVTGPVNLPLFADCNITEPSPPAGVTITAPSVAVTAERDLSEDPAVWQPYIGDTAAAGLEITNEFHVGEFTVAKTVDAGGAIDQNGNPIAYDYAFDFTVSCIYLGQEVVPVADRTFSLSDGASKTFTAIPTGAACRVTEADPGLAGSTVTNLTRNGVVTSTNGVDVDFLVGDETTPVAIEFENAMTVGSLEVAKVVTGAGAADFGQGPFTMHVLCTLDAADPNTVYDGSLILGGTQPLAKQVNDLPTGAECTVTETDAAGAQHVAVTPTPAIIGVADVVTVTVTNTFTIGSLEIEKRIDGPGAALYGAGPFEITIDCVLNGVPVTVPGGAARALTDANGYTALYDTLPVGAVCGIEETDQGGASSVEITDDAANPISEVTITGAATPTQVIVTNTFDLGSIEVSKFVWGDPNGDHQKRVFTIELRCEVAGNQITIPGGASRGLTVADRVVYADLPVGADCSLVETDNGGAVSTTMTPADPTDASKARVVVTGGAAASIVVDNMYEIGLPLTGGERTMWILPFGGVLLLLGAALIVVRRVRRTRVTH